MKVYSDLNIGAAFKDEAAFKAEVLRVKRKKSPHITFFEIENEEKEPGMPDCLAISGNRAAFFIEFKISDKKGVVEFEKTQPLFYMRNSKLLIDILAWDARSDRVVYINPEEVIKAKTLKIQIPEKLE